ncbi:hypothetical protein GCM10023224_04790 [Streptomonospora halophila]|uniref:Uncharacterized protein n=1 Tax=Streptomonospora halophila TaxID=427369 RepID=A0ABP9G544_9ACTN
MSDDVDAMVAWLRAQWDADEKAARGAADGPWADGFRAGTEAAKDRAAALVADDIPDGPANAHLIEDLEVPVPEGAARHDPADTLARIDAERRIVADYEQAAAEYASTGRAWDHDSETGRARTSALETAVRALASGYRHRAGWQQGWAP